MAQSDDTNRADENIAAESTAGDSSRADALAREEGRDPGAQVAASDPRSLTVDRGGQQSSSPEADKDAQVAAEQANGE